MKLKKTSVNWILGRGGLCGGLKILRRWFNSIRIHQIEKFLKKSCQKFCRLKNYCYICGVK